MFLLARRWAYNQIEVAVGCWTMKMSNNYSLWKSFEAYKLNYTMNNTTAFFFNEFSWFRHRHKKLVYYWGWHKPQGILTEYVTGWGGSDIFFWVEISLAQEICHIFWSEKICIFLGDDLHNVMCVDVEHLGGWINSNRHTDLIRLLMQNHTLDWIN